MTELHTGRVECYSGHTYAQEPRAVIWRGQRRPVVRVEQRWRTPQGPGFRVRTEPGERFELQYLELEDRWVVRCFQPHPQSNGDAPEDGARFCETGARASRVTSENDNSLIQDGTTSRPEADVA